MITQARLIMVPAPPKFPTEGVGRHILEISRRLSVAFQVTGVDVQGAPWDCLSSKNGYRTVTYQRFFDFPSLRTGSTFLDSALYNLTLMTNFRSAVTAALKESRVPAVVHTHGFWSATMARRPRGNWKWVATVHGFRQLDLRYEANSLIRAGLLQGVLRKAYAGADHYTAFTAKDAVMLASLYGVEQRRITVVPHGVNSDFFAKRASVEEIRSIEEKYSMRFSPRVLFFGSANADRHLPLLVEAFKDTLVQTKGECMLLMLSTWGDDLHNVRRVIRDSDIHKIKLFENAVSETELRSIYQSCQIFVTLYTRRFGVSTALLEAMAAGEVPVVLRNTAQADVVDESCGVVLDRLSAPEIADALSRLVSDDKLRRRLGSNAAQKMCNEHDWDRVVVPRYSSIYHALAES